MKKIKITIALMLIILTFVHSTLLMVEAKELAIGGQMGGGMELPEDWDEMTDEEKQAYLEENRPDDMGQMGGGMELPEDWDEMTDEEKQAYLEENRPDGAGEGELNRAQNYTKHALKASNYEKFTGDLEDVEDFNDEEEIQNKEAVQYLQQRGILNGYTDGTFRPSNSISRAESIKVLLEALDFTLTESTESSFTDVSTDDWYFKYVQTAKEEGFISGYDDGTFRPKQTVAQTELLKIAFETFGIDLSDYEVTSLPEGIDEDVWYAPYLQYALDNNLLDEADVNPSESMTREAFAEVIYRLIQQQEEVQE